MTALVSALRRQWAASPVVPRELSLPPRAQLHYGTVVLAALAATAASLYRLPWPVHGWVAFGVLTAGAAFAQLYIVETGKNQSYRTAIAFIVAAAVVLRPGFLGPLVLLHYVPSWVKYRKKWLVQTFNIANTTLATLAAAAAYRSLSATSVALAGAFACAAFVLVNHVVLARMIETTSDKSMLATGLFSFESVSADFALAALGIGVAAFWTTDRWLILFVLGPLMIIHRALYVPQLRELAQFDAKTGLVNAKEFERVLDAELARAERTETPLSLLMVDLDLLREINNAHGHLAGDAVIQGVADVFREELRRYDVPGRFGGDEFCVLLPETPRREAEQIADRIREVVAAREFAVEASTQSLRATVSVGIATWPDDAATATALLHAADVGAYREKAERS